MGKCFGRAALLLLAWAGGCGLHQQYPEHLDLQAGPSLARENPAEVAILPVANRSGSARAQKLLPELRRAFYLALRDRHYTPLALAFVDRNPGLESLAPGQEPPSKELLGSFQEDALLVITVTRWDESYLKADRSLRVGLEARLLSSASKEELWGGVADFEVKVSGHGMAGPAEEEAMRQDGLERAALRVLSELPRRKNVPEKVQEG